MGWSVFPVRRDKRPAVPHGVNDADNDAGPIAEFYSRNPGLGVAVAMGSRSGGIFAIDIDVDEEAGKDGWETLRRWEDEHGALPETVTSITGRGGCHMIYRSAAEVRNSVNSELGVDVRGEGGYIIAPPSMHESGRRYEWQDPPGECQVAWADANVMAFVDFVRAGKEAGERFEMPESVGEGGRNSFIYKLACSEQGKGRPDGEIMDYCLFVNQRRCTPPLPEGEVTKTVESALSLRKGPSEEVARRSKGKSQGMTLDLTKSGAPKNTVHNIETILTGDPLISGRLWFNSMAYTKFITTPCPWDPSATSRPVSDYDYGHLQAYVEHEYGISSKQKLIDAVGNVCTKNARNPLAEWLDTLSWDGEERIFSLFPLFLGADVTEYNGEVARLFMLGAVARAYEPGCKFDYMPILSGPQGIGPLFLGADVTEYNGEVARLFMLGAVARAYEPGCKFDYMPILSGPQGIGKSSLLRTLATRQEWYCDNLNTVEGDAAAEKIRGMWICEMAELLASKRSRDVEAMKAFVTSAVDTIRPKYGRETEQRPRTCVFCGTTNSSSFLVDKTDVEAMKAFVTSAVDTIRPKYGRETEQRPRTCVFCGTTNSSSFLVDKTGNRRFLVVECGAGRAELNPVVPGDSGRLLVEQCWAEAAHVWKDRRPSLVMPAHLDAEVQSKQDAYTEDDPRVGLIQRYMDNAAARAEGGATVRVCAAEVMVGALGIDRKDCVPGAAMNQVHEIMAASTGKTAFPVPP